MFASGQKIEETMLRRIRIMLRIAVQKDYKNLVLGAWGCGAFGNDANAVADAKAEEIAKVYNAIKASNPDDKLVQLKSLEALEEVAKGEANKIFIPFEATSALSSLGAAKEMFTDKK